MQPTASTTLARILRVRCPRCGRGAIFRTFFLRADCCSDCTWKFERESGFWVGGSEVHMVISYGLSVVLFIPLLILLGPTLPVQLGVIFGHIVCSLSLFRLSRAMFIGLDFYFDPVARSDEDGGGEGEAVPVAPRPRRPLRQRHEPKRYEPKRREPKRLQPSTHGSRYLAVPLEEAAPATTAQARTARR